MTSLTSLGAWQGRPAPWAWLAPSCSPSELRVSPSVVSRGKSKFICGGLGSQRLEGALRLCEGWPGLGQLPPPTFWQRNVKQPVAAPGLPQHLHTLTASAHGTLKTGRLSKLPLPPGSASKQLWVTGMAPDRSHGCGVLTFQDTPHVIIFHPNLWKILHLKANLMSPPLLCGSRGPGPTCLVAGRLWAPANEHGREKDHSIYSLGSGLRWTDLSPVPLCLFLDSMNAPALLTNPQFKDGWICEPSSSWSHYWQLELVVTDWLLSFVPTLTRPRVFCPMHDSKTISEDSHKYSKNVPIRSLPPTSNKNKSRVFSKRATNITEKIPAFID